MSILSTNHRLISIGESYSAGNGIDITDQVISVTGDAIPYSAGENIDIQDHIISGKDWSNDITEASSHAYNETTAWVKENYANSADMTYISAVVDTKLDASAWSSVSGDFATESYVIMSDNITYDRAKGYVDSKGYATEEFVNENTSGKLDSTAFTNWQNGQYSTDLQTIENQISNKLDTTSFSTVSGTFLTDDNTVMLEYGTSTWAEFKSAYDAHKNIVMYKQDIGDITNQYATFGYAFFDDTPYEASFTTVCFGTEYRFTLNSNNVWKSYSQMYQYRGNYYSASNPSGFITGVSIPESAVWQDVSTTVQSNSAQWGQGGGVTGNYIPYTAVNTGLGCYVTNSGLRFLISDARGVESTYIDKDQILISYTGTGFPKNWRSVLSPETLTFEFKSNSNSDSAYVDREKIHTWDSASNYIQSNSANWNDVSTTVQSNSAQWAEVGVTGEFVPQSAFDELKQSYDALSSMLATYSGQWLLPNEGV